MKRNLFLTILLFFTCFAARASAQGALPLERVEDVPLPGGSSRFDYQSMDSESGRLYIAHLGANRLVVFDTRNRRVLAEVGDLANVHGVVAVPELHRVFAKATGTNELAVIGDEDLRVRARVPAGDYPNGLAYDEGLQRLYVSAESGVVTIFDERGRNLEKVWGGFFAKNAHSVAVDQQTHRVYFPLENVNGKPVLRIVVPTDKDSK